MAKSFFVLAACLIAISPAAAGIIIEIETNDQQPGRPQVGTTRVSVEGRMLTMEISPDNPGEQGDQIIFRGDRREMLIIDHNRKTFMVMDQQTLKNMAGQLNQALGQAAGQLGEAMKNLPEAQRAMAEQLMKSQSAGQQPQQRPQIVVHQLNQHADVYGYPCVLFEVLRDGKRVRNFWVTDWNNIAGGRRDLAPAFDEMSSFFQEIQAAMPPMGQGDQMTNNVFAQIKQLGGFPVATREYTSNGDLESESALRTAKRQQINPAVFAPPAGYRREEMFGGRQPPQIRR